jgi:hypothetical protein
MDGVLAHERMAGVVASRVAIVSSEAGMSGVMTGMSIESGMAGMAVVAGVRQTAEPHRGQSRRAERERETVEVHDWILPV